MAFTRFGLFFKQDFEGGYRYLDRCGEFLVRAQQSLRLFPSGDISPQGGQLEAPDLGIKAECNTTFLRVSHELPENDTATFTRYATELAALYEELFSPAAVERTGVAVHAFMPFSEVGQAQAKSLQWGDKHYETLSRELGMIPVSRTGEYTFRSGSRQLLTKIHPATFDKVSLVSRNAGARATARQREIMTRQNAGVKRVLKTEFSHALLIELDLTEDNPAPNSFPALFRELLDKEASLLNQLFLARK